MAWVLIGLGLVLFVEGLAWALAPSLIEKMLEALRLLPIEQRRMMGLAAMAAGLVILWAAQAVMG